MLLRQAGRHREYMAIVEGCGFNDWLIEKLKEYRCNEIVVMQPDSSSNKKTDKQIITTETELAKRTENNKEVAKMAAIPDITAMGASTLLSRIGGIKRFRNPDSLESYVT